MKYHKAIQIKNLYYCYPDGTKALKGVDLVVKEDESVAIVGPNGAGKSTLLLHLNGILNGSGQVNIMDLLLDRKNVSRIRSLVGVIFQDPEDQLFMPTVFDDVAFGPLNMGLSPSEICERVELALGEVGLPGFEQRSAHHLSLGEKKRVAIATVLSMKPEILVIDEPSSNLDPKTRRHLIDLLKGFNYTKIIATHDMNLAWQLCERTVVMDEGKIVADGPSSDILRDGELLRNHGLEVPTIISS